MAEKSGKSKKQTISVAVRIVVALFALMLFLKGENLKELWGVLIGLNPLVFLAAMALYVVGQFLFVLRWRLLLKVLDIDLSVWAGVKLHLLGLFYNSCLPSSVGGDLLRAWYVTKHTENHRKFDAALSVFVDRAVGLSGMIMMACFFYWVVPVGDVFEGQRIEQSQESSGDGLAGMIHDYRAVIWSVVGLLAVCIIGLFATKKGRELLVKIRQKIVKLGSKIIVESLEAVKRYGKRPLSVVIAYLLTFVCQGMSIYGCYILGKSFGMEVALKYYYVFFPLSWMIGVVPVSIGGLGVVEGFLKEAFKSVGAESEKAVAVAVCQRLILMISSAPGVFIHMFGGHLPVNDKEFFIDAEESID